MYWYNFFKLFFVASIPACILIALEVKDRIKYKQFNSVQTSFAFRVVFLLESFVSLFFAVKNLIQEYVGVPEKTQIT